MQKLISFIIPSRSPQNVVHFLNTLKDTTKEPSMIEVLLKLDDDFIEETKIITEQLHTWPFDIKYIHTPRLEGIYSLALAVEQLFHLTADSYFVQILSDEPFFTTMHWDIRLAKYIHFFPDDIFRLRLSKYKFKNYSTHYECVVQPDSYPIYTRKWLELTQGTGDCWGSDAYHQCIAFHLGLGSRNYSNFFSENSHYRDIPIINITMGGLDFGVGLTAEVLRQRTRRNLKEWNRLSSFHAQEKFSYLARRIECAIYAHSHKIQNYTLKNNKLRKSVSLINQNNAIVIEISYGLPRLRIGMENLTRYIKTLPRLTLSRVKHKFFNSNNHKSDSGLDINKTKNIIQSSILTINAVTNFFLYLVDSRLLKKRRPGISMLYSKRPDLCVGASKPTNQAIIWLNQELKKQTAQEHQLETKRFTS